ncbi:MAG: hypothetical protein Q8L98_03875 [Chlamydiales bacterium]|nr:hypothetical protein [Chlamydiales bacterium]
MSYRLEMRHNPQDIHYRLIDFNKLLSDKPEEAHFLWGERIFTWACPKENRLYQKNPNPQAKNYLSLKSLATSILKISRKPDALSIKERAAGIEIVQKTISLYQHTDNKLPFKGVITRILAAIREGTWLSFLFPIADQTRFQLETGTISNLASFEEKAFCKEFDLPPNMPIDKHEAFAGRVTLRGQTRILAKTDVLLAKAMGPRQLTNILLQGEDRTDPYIQTLDSNLSFERDPTSFMIDEMIDRGLGMCMTNDSTRARIMSRIPHFIKSATSINYLKEFAKDFFVYGYCGVLFTDEEKLEVFETSLNNERFLKQLEKAKKHFEQEEFSEADAALRVAYLIFPCAHKLQEFHLPEDGPSEKTFTSP